MRIISMLPVLAFGDAVGNDAITVHKSLKKAGYESVMVASVIDERLGKDVAVSADDLSWINRDDVVIYHMSNGHVLNERFAMLSCQKIVKYHNITPAEYFFGYSHVAMINSIGGYFSVSKCSQKVSYCLADSEYNKRELQKMGYNCPIDVLPILIPFEDYKKEPDAQVIKQMEDGYTNIIFTGRVVPNKRHEDVIAAFSVYKKWYNPKSRLILVGDNTWMKKYYEDLKKYVQVLGVEDVIFTGHISFAGILAYYRSADLFLCMSDHEGFCVPLVEAMYFDVPVLAKNTSAIADTLGGSGMLLPDQNPTIAAAAMHRILTDERLRTQMLENQKERLKDFDHDKVEKILLDKIREYVEKT